MNVLSDLLVDIAACLCQTIKDSDRQDVCFCGIVPGGAAAATYAGNCTGKNGMAWVRLGPTYPSQSIGVADESVGNCSTGLGADIEVGIMRLIEVAEGTTNLRPETILRQSTDQHDDMLLIRQAIVCCDALDAKDYILGAYLPIGPSGGMVGGAWTVHIGVY